MKILSGSETGEKPGKGRWKGHTVVIESNSTNVLCGYTERRR